MKYKKYTKELQKSFSVKCHMKETKEDFKRELKEVLQKHGYIEERKDYEIMIRTSSCNIAWINIKGLKIIK